MATLTDAFTLARGWVGERTPAGEVFTDAFLLIFAPEVYREIQRRMVKAGVSDFKTYAQFNVAVGVLSVTDGATGYPTNVISPIRLWERLSTSVLYADFVQMEEADPDLVPRAAAAVLTHWEWKAKTLNFIGASTIRTIRMLYYNYLADLTAVGSTLGITDCLGAVAMGTVAAAARSRGSTLAADAEGLFNTYVDSLIGRDAKRAWNLGAVE